MRGSCRVWRSRGRSCIVPISRPCLTFVSSWRAWVEALPRRRHPSALAAAKGCAVGVVLSVLMVLGVLGAMVRLGTGIVGSRLFSPWLLHLLPCGEDICPSLRIFGPCVWSLCSWRLAKVPACESIGAACIRGILLWWRRPWLLLLLLLLRGGFGWRRTVVGSAGRGRGIRIARRRWRPCSWGVGRVCGDVQVAVLSSLGIVFCSLGLIAKNLVCSLDLLELDDEFRLAAWIAVGVVLQRKASKGFPDLVLGCVGRDFEIRVVVSSGISFHHSCGCACG